MNTQQQEKVVLTFFLLQKRWSTKVLRLWCPINEQSYKCNGELLHTRDIQAYISRPFRTIVYNEDYVVGYVVAYPNSLGIKDYVVVYNEDI